MTIEKLIIVKILFFLLRVFDFYGELIWMNKKLVILMWLKLSLWCAQLAMCTSGPVQHFKLGVSQMYPS
jgi:hypothetical protein